MIPSRGTNHQHTPCVGGWQSGIVGTWNDWSEMPNMIIPLGTYYNYNDLWVPDTASDCFDDIMSVSPATEYLMYWGAATTIGQFSGAYRACLKSYGDSWAAPHEKTYTMSPSPPGFPYLRCQNAYVSYCPTGWKNRNQFANDVGSWSGWANEDGTVSIPYTMTKEVCYYEARRAYPNARYINYHSQVCSVVMNGNEPAVSGYKPWWVSSYAKNVCQVY